MGLASGGGGGGGYRGGGFGTGYILGRMGSGNSDIDPIAAIAGTLALTAILGVVIGFAVSDNKKTEAAKAELNNTIVETINEKGGELASVDATYFDWETQDSDYFFKFTGNAMTVDNEKIDFFSAKYQVNEQQYYETLEYIEKENIEDLDTRSLLERLTGIVKESELVESNVLENVATKGVASSEIEKTSDNVILNVTKPIIGENTVGYRVCYLQGVKTTDGKLGVVTSYAEVQYDKTEDLAKNPASVFLKDKKLANVNVVHRDYSPIEPYQIMNFKTEQAQDAEMERL